MRQQVSRKRHIRKVSRRQPSAKMCYKQGNQDLASLSSDNIFCEDICTSLDRYDFYHPPTTSQMGNIDNILAFKRGKDRGLYMPTIWSDISSKSFTNTTPKSDVAVIVVIMTVVVVVEGNSICWTTPE